ncbi:uncharacterized protein LOC143220034 [Lasioglossum baleicum]|uniref:uncharacterized protein LOC143220034 n=1 Tax=Lasioglossum baleicum TaxID=434251 RepID=UPI003FCE3C81
MASNLYLTSFYFLFIISSCMGNICLTCSCSTTNDASIVNCNEKYLGNKDVLYSYLLMLDRALAFDKLILSNNNIINLSEDLLKALKSLKSLDLSENWIENIHTRSFNDLYRLENLNFSKNNLATFDTSLLKALPTLLTLDLSYNHIHLIERTIDGTVTKVISLNLSHNNISQIPKNLFDSLSNLQYLDLSFNQIHSLEDIDLEYLHSLKVLHVNNNFLTSLDIRIFPKSVIELFAGYNLIKEIYYTPCQIKVLNIEFNHISQIQSNITALKELHSLNISGNEISNFPKVSFQNLKTLDLTCNKLAYIPETLSTINLPSLVEFNVSKNPIQNLSFPSILKLQSFVASNISMLYTIDESTFANLYSSSTKCISLTISNNENLFSIHENALDHLHLCSLDLSNNHISYIASKLVLRNNNLTTRKVYLQGNPIKCDCSMQWLLDNVVPKLYKTDPNLLDNLRCAWPPQLSNIRIVHWYGWDGKVFCSDMSNKLSVNAVAESTDNQMVTFDSSPGLLVALGLCTGLLSILMIVGIIWSRKLILRKRRFNRKF